MKVKLKVKYGPPAYEKNLEHWTHSEPFYQNPNGKLCHRVKCVQTHNESNGGISHYSLTYWCGNVSCFASPPDDLLSAPNNRLLCERCEAIAVAAGEKTASELAGHHVHTGRLVPIQTCCTEKKNRN